MDDRDAEPARLVVKGVDRGDDLPRPGRRARAVGRVGEMALMHVDRDHGRLAAVGVELEPVRQDAAIEP